MTQPQAQLTPEERNKDHQKRMRVFVKTRQTVLIKLYGSINPMAGFEVKVRDNKEVHQKHKEEAQRQGLRLNNYRPAGDTGFPVFGKSGDGRFNIQKRGSLASDFIDQLRRIGLVYTGCHCFPQWGRGFIQDKRYTHVLEFNRPDSVDDASMPYSEQPVPHAAMLLLKECSFQTTVWANLNLVGNQEIRVDTINLSNPEPLKPGKDQHLHLEGSTYRMR